MTFRSKMNSTLIVTFLLVALVAVYIPEVLDWGQEKMVPMNKMKENDRLASKAFTAGGDWDEEKKQKQKDTGCFPGEATITLENGDVISMSQLRVKDSVLAATRDGAPVFSKVVGWFERIPDERVSYRYLSTGTGKTLALSPDHVLFTVDGTKLASRLSKDVGVGDIIRVVSSNRSENSEVTHVEQKFTKGAYVPVTEHGTIVVDGVLASCYVATDHDLTHALLTPLRWFPGLFLDPMGEPNREGARPLISLFHVAYKLLIGEERHIIEDRKVEFDTRSKELTNSCPSTLFIDTLSTRV